MISHAELVARACQMAWDRGLYVHCCRDGRACEGPGLPDLIIAGPRGILWREVKSRAAPKPRPDQRSWLRMLRASGQDAAVWKETDFDTGRAGQEMDAIMRATG